MKPFEFKIISKCFQDASQYSGEDADFYLEENDWNDYYYYVLYYLHATKRLTGTKNMLLGYVRIMKVGQQKNEKYLLSQQFQRKVFTELPENFVSLSLEYDLYKWLSFRPVEERKALASQLHMILSEQSPYYEMVKEDECFLTAMLRDSTMDNIIFVKADRWINQVERRYDLRSQRIKVIYDNCDMEIPLSFSCLSGIDSDDIPNGIVAFIGENGSGKSTALYNLAKAMYLYPEDRESMMRKFCQIIPNDIGVERLLLISYSPFDNFTIPSTENHAMNEVQGLTRDNDERFIYCGIRDIALEFREQHANGGLKDINYLQRDRQEITIAKTQDRLAADFACAFQTIIDGEDKSRFTIWTEIIEKAAETQPDLAEKMSIMTNLNSIKERADYFKSLSTGYKFFFHSVSYVISYILEGSLVLFDEPENHIHPPLLSFMMARYRELLSRFKSVMLVSTHSPVVIQEVFADNVMKVYREGAKIIIRNPEIETYGATFGDINSEVFGLTSDVTTYFKAIDTLYETWNLRNEESAERMLQQAQLNLRRPLSNQVVSYLISKFYGDNPNKI